jgi:hypothetical protein
MSKNTPSRNTLRDRVGAKPRYSLLRLFGSPQELVDKADADLSRLVNSLTRGEQREALWALMDCAIAVFHVGDWLRATHTDHHASSHEFGLSSQWIRMTRDICHSAKHGDLTWADALGATHSPVIARLEYEAAPGDDGHRRADIWVVTNDQTRYSVPEVLQHAIADWKRFLAQSRI